MGVFKYAWFDKFCRTKRITDAMLCEAILKKAAMLILGLPDRAMSTEVESGRLKEVKYNEQGL